MKYLFLIIAVFALTSCAKKEEDVNAVKKNASWSLKLCEGSVNFYRNCEVVDNGIPNFDQCARDQRDFSKMLPKGEVRSVVCLQDQFYASMV